MVQMSNVFALLVLAMASCINTTWADRFRNRRRQLTSYECKLPHGTDQYSVISKGDANIGAHNMYKGMAIGGTLYDGTPTENGTVDYSISYVKHLDSNTNFNFNGGLITSQFVPYTMIEHFEWLAKNAKSSSTSDGKRVFVLTKGGTYNLYDFVPGGQGEDNGNTIVIFNTSEDIYITKTHDGRQFGPSIIAPFAKVFILGDAGYVDGFIMADKVWTTGSNQGQLQLHGDTYRGTFVCHDYPPAPTCIAKWGDCAGKPHECCSGTVCKDHSGYMKCGDPPAPTCIAKWGDCAGKPHECCSGTVCKDHSGYMKCVDPPAPTCIAKWGDCAGKPHECCSGTVCKDHSGHMKCVDPPPPEPTCIAKWGDCTGKLDKCCAGSVCHVQNPYYAQCLDPAPTCIAKWGDCTGKLDKCCTGSVCQVKNPWYAQCLAPLPTCIPKYGDCTGDKHNCCNPYACKEKSYGVFHCYHA